MKGEFVGGSAGPGFPVVYDAVPLCAAFPPQARVRLVVEASALCWTTYLNLGYKICIMRKV